MERPSLEKKVRRDSARDCKIIMSMGGMKRVSDTDGSVKHKKVRGKDVAVRRPD